MKRLATIVLLLSSLTVWGQKKIAPTNELLVTGLVKKEVKFTLKDIEKLPSENIPDIAITGHNGEIRSSLKQTKGVLIKGLLKNIELKEDNPKLFSEFYFIFIASDDYKVVYSWNEIFNSPTGNHLYIITSVAGKPLKDLKNRILVLTSSDFKTGRRYIKCLSKIVVGRVE